MQQSLKYLQQHCSSYPEVGHVATMVDS